MAHLFLKEKLKNQFLWFVIVIPFITFYDLCEIIFVLGNSEVLIIKLIQCYEVRTVDSNYLKLLTTRYVIVFRINYTFSLKVWNNIWLLFSHTFTILSSIFKNVFVRISLTFILKLLKRTLQINSLNAIWQSECGADKTHYYLSFSTLANFRDSVDIKDSGISNHVFFYKSPQWPQWHESKVLHKTEVT